MIRLFLDTDFGPDCDDAGALQLVHYLCDAGEAELMGVTHCTGNPYGLPAISALNRFNGREVPLGTMKGGFLAEYTKYNRPMSEMFSHEFEDGQPQRDAKEVFREVMSRQEDKSVTVCSIGPLNNLRAEVTVGDSRFDFCAEQDGRRVVIEVKGCTLEFDGKCYFPDAPTERGVKHINELIHAAEEGYECYIFFVVQMKNVNFLSPNDATHPEFGEALRNAERRGVHILAYDCFVEPDYLKIGEKIPVKL